MGCLLGPPEGTGCGVAVRNHGPLIPWDYSGCSAKMRDGAGGERSGSPLLEGGVKERMNN